MNGIGKRYRVVFKKKGIAHNIGDVADVSFPVARDFFNRGLVNATDEMLADAHLYGCEFKKKNKRGKQ